MFNNLFSFKGRITRTEYILSTIVSNLILIIAYLFIRNYKHSSLLLLFIFVSYLWFSISQKTKRCHDLNHSGIMQIIPFYGFVLLFGEGTEGPYNNYGINPRVKENDDKKQTKRVKIKTTGILTIVQLTLPFALLNTLLLSVFFKVITNTILFNLLVYISIILCYFLFLSLVKEKKEISFYPKMTQLFYSIILFFLVRLYVYFFLKYEFLFSTFPLELLFMLIPFGLTFISCNLHTFFFKSK